MAGTPWRVAAAWQNGSRFTALSPTPVPAGAAHTLIPHIAAGVMRHAPKLDDLSSVGGNFQRGGGTFPSAITPARRDTKQPTGAQTQRHGGKAAKQPLRDCATHWRTGGATLARSTRSANQRPQRLHLNL